MPIEGPGHIDMVVDVLAFHRKFGCAIGRFPAVPVPSLIQLRRDLIDEEHGELGRAVEKKSVPDVADAIVDLIYVTIGKAIVWGIDIRPIWRAVQRANMAKEGGGKRADGKILKPPGWQPPEVEGLIGQQILFAKSNGGSVWIPQEQTM